MALLDNLSNWYRLCPSCDAVDITVDPLNVDGEGQRALCKRCAVKQAKARAEAVAACTPKAGRCQ